MKTSNILILGNARHGKDSFAELLCKHNPCLSFASSSWILAEEVVYPILKDQYNYQTLEECYEDRPNHRGEWFNLLKSYNTPDGTRLARKIYEENNLYVGMRNQEEFLACLQEDLFDLIFWVDASKRKPLESKESFNIDFDCDLMLLIDNNGSLKQLEHQAMHWAPKLTDLNFYL